MYDLLTKELEKHGARTVFIANKIEGGIAHYYISKEFPMMGGFDEVITRKINELGEQLGQSSDYPVAYCKLTSQDDRGAIYMGVYFADVGERRLIIYPEDFPKLPKSEDSE